MHVLLTPVGSHGDVHPFVALGRGLKARGHMVSLIAAEPYRSLAEVNGFEFVQTMPAEEFEQFAQNPDLWHPENAMKVLFDPELAAQWLPYSFERIRERYRPGEAVVVAGALGMASRVASEVLGIPLATIHLAPVGLFSAYKPPIYPTLRFRSWWPRWFRRWLFNLGERHVLDPMLGRVLHPFRDSFGLPRGRRFMSQWINSPQLVLGFFPEWFASAPDWPTQFRHTGFLRYDQGDHHPVPDSLREFLSAGEAPIVFSFGSAMRTGHRYFETALAVCQSLGVRGVLMAKGASQIPKNLPKSVLHVEYAPFSKVFPSAKAVVHHGGIGTSAQAMTAGVPQLLMPMAFDQPDNAERLRKLGVARYIPAAKFTPVRAITALKELLADPTVPTASAELAKRMSERDPVTEACRAVESLQGQDRPPFQAIGR